MVPISRREEVTTTRDCSKNRLSHLWEKLWIGFYVVPTFESPPPHSDLGKTLKNNRTTVSRRKWTKRVGAFAVGEQKNNQVKGAKNKVTFVQTLN